MSGSIMVYNPTGVKKGNGAVTPAPRLTTLQGKRLAVIWNGKLGGDVFLKRVSEILADRYGVSGIEWINDRGDTKKVINLSVVEYIAATCDGAVIGTGD
jgi:hypothetical protein